MANNEKINQQTSAQDEKMPLGRRNYVILIVGFALIVLGMVLMSGGASASPEEFNYEMFSWRRITLAPILIVAGFIVEIYGIMKR